MNERSLVRPSEEGVQFMGSPFVGLVPMGFFMAGAMYLGISGAPDERGFWPVVVGALIVGALLAKNREVFGRKIIEGMTHRVVGVMVAAWLLAGCVGQMVRASGSVEHLAYALSGSDVGPAMFLVGTFAVSALVGTSTGTAVGTVLIVTPAVFSAGMAVGCDPYWLLGAVLGGGAFGDDFSPISDTTIAAAETQGVEVPTAVRSQIKYAVVAGGIAAIVYCIAGVSGSAADSGAVVTPPASRSESLLVLVGPVFIVVMCMLRHHLVVALLFGLLITAVAGLAVGVFSAGDIFSIDPEHFTARSIIIDGMARGVGISVFSILLVGLIHAVVSGGLLERILASPRLTRLLERHCEVGIVVSVVVTNALTAHNTIAMIGLGDFVREAGERSGVAPLRRTNLIDGAGNTVMHIFPYMITVVLATSLAAKEPSAPSGLNAITAGMHNAHSWALLALVLFASMTGLWRRVDA